jgi:hypothetical protein
VLRLEGKFVCDLLIAQDTDPRRLPKAIAILVQNLDPDGPDVQEHLPAQRFLFSLTCRLKLL